MTQYNVKLSRNTRGPADDRMILMDAATKTSTFTSADQTDFGPGKYMIYLRVTDFDSTSHAPTLAVTVQSDNDSAFGSASVLGKMDTITGSATFGSKLYALGVESEERYMNVVCTMSAVAGETGEFEIWAEKIG